MTSCSAEQQSRQAIAVFLLFIALLASLAVIVGIGWWVWENIITNPLPYSDPEAIRTAVVIAPR